MTLPAPAKWAQRRDKVFITFEVPDCSNPQITFDSNKLTFEGKCKTTNANYKNVIDTYEEIVCDECVWSNKTKSVECTLLKKDTFAPFWPRLCKLKMKQHWLHVDFGKWKDEDDESDEDDQKMGAGDGPDLSQMMQQLGRGSGTVDPNSMNDLPSDSDDDSDDEDIPDLDTDEAGKNTEDNEKPEEIPCEENQNSDEKQE